MITALFLAAVLGQVNAADGPPRQWLPGVIGGKTVQIWGWRDPATGGVGYRAAENHHLYPQFAPRPAAPTLPNTGIVLESSGDLNSGLKIEQAKPTESAGFDTNDPGLLDKIGLDGDYPDGRCPNNEPDLPDIAPRPRSSLRDYLPSVVLLVLAIGAALAIGASRQPR